MTSLNTIKPNKGSRRAETRVGRGNGSGKGTFSGRGMNGQNCRSGGGVPDWFEGGQTPLFRRLPKLKGFSNIRFKKKFNVVNLDDLQILADKKITTVDKAVLLENRIIRKKNLPVKLLGRGELKSKLTIKLDFASQSAKAAVEKAGSTIELA
jgi:large subunit ribosomal protein L15